MLCIEWRCRKFSFLPIYSSHDLKPSAICDRNRNNWLSFNYSHLPIALSLILTSNNRCQSQYSRMFVVSISLFPTLFNYFDLIVCHGFCIALTTMKCITAASGRPHLLWQRVKHYSVCLWVLYILYHFNVTSI